VIWGRFDREFETRQNRGAHDAFQSYTWDVFSHGFAYREKPEVSFNINKIEDFIRDELAPAILNADIAK
jgi:hypothetical protein